MMWTSRYIFGTADGILITKISFSPLKTCPTDVLASMFAITSLEKGGKTEKDWPEYSPRQGWSRSSESAETSEAESPRLYT